jgi:hypothetical protein
MGCFRVLVVSDLLTVAHIHQQIGETGQVEEVVDQSGCILIPVILLLSLLLQILVFLVQLLHSLLMPFSHFLVLQPLLVTNGGPVPRDSDITCILVSQCSTKFMKKTKTRFNKLYQTTVKTTPSPSLSPCRSPVVIPPTPRV